MPHDLGEARGMNEESPFAALDKPTATGRRAFLDEACAVHRSPRQTNRVVGLVEDGHEGTFFQALDPWPALAKPSLLAARTHRRGAQRPHPQLAQLLQHDSLLGSLRRG